jgi:hypothetical protein
VTANASLYVSIGIDVSTAGSKNASPSECPGTVSIMERIYLRCADSRCSLWQHATDIMEASAKFQLLEIYMIDSAETVKIGFFEYKTCCVHEAILKPSKFAIALLICLKLVCDEHNRCSGIKFCTTYLITVRTFHLERIMYHNKTDMTAATVHPTLFKQ